MLLGVEIAASRVLAPTFGSSLYVWGSLIGIVLTGLAVGYWARWGRRRPDAEPVPARRRALARRRSRRPRAAPRRPGPRLDRRLGSRPAPRSARSRRAPVRAAERRARVGLADRGAARGRSLERLGRTAGRLFSISTAGSIFGTFVTAFWLVPELRHRSGARARGGRARRGGARRLARRAARAGSARARRCPRRRFGPDRSLAPEQHGTTRGVAAQNWSPLYRQREERTPGPLDPASVEPLGEGSRCGRPATRATTACSSSTTATPAISASTTRSRAACGSLTRIARGSYTDYLDLGLAHRPAARDVLFIGLGGGSAPKRMWRDFPRLRLQAVELDPDVVAAAYRWFELPRDPRLAVRSRRRPTLADAARQALGRDRDRRLLRRLDPVPSGHLEFLQLVRERLAPGASSS